MACDLAVTLACQNGQLEINQFLPLVSINKKIKSLVRD
jgi:aspartate ammonia-lyase